MRTGAIILGLFVVAALGIALRGDPLIGAGVAVLGGLTYYVGYLDGSVAR